MLRIGRPNQGRPKFPDDTKLTEHQPKPQERMARPAQGRPLAPRRLSPPAAKVTHPGITCDGCGEFPIQNIRYKCTSCADFDLCDKCEDRSVAREHERLGHVFAKIRDSTNADISSLPQVATSRGPLPRPSPLSTDQPRCVPRPQPVVWVSFLSCVCHEPPQLQATPYFILVYDQLCALAPEHC